MVEEKRDLLTPEQQAMWKRRHRQEKSDSTTPEQKKAWNKDLRRKLEAMSPADLAQTRLALQVEWDAQPAEQKEKKLTRIGDKARKSLERKGESDDD